MTAFEPTVIGFLCNWCAYEGADAAGRARLTYPAGFRIVRVMCSGRVHPRVVLSAFAQGADAVMVLGCPGNDCHYRRGNLQAMKRMALLSPLLIDLGIDARRLCLDWVSAGDGARLAQFVAQTVETVRGLGPLRRPKNHGGRIDAGGVRQ
jgi:F420-non-reducing hydrogenase iron-sulfur subunit